MVVADIVQQITYVDHLCTDHTDVRKPSGQLIFHHLNSGGGIVCWGDTLVDASGSTSAVVGVVMSVHSSLLTSWNTSLGWVSDMKTKTRWLNVSVTPDEESAENWLSKTVMN